MVFFFKAGLVSLLSVISDGPVVSHFISVSISSHSITQHFVRRYIPCNTRITVLSTYTEIFSERILVVRVGDSLWQMCFPGVRCL